MQDFDSMKIGLYVNIFNAIPNKENFHIHGDSIIGDNKTIVITPNLEPGMTGRVNIALTCKITNVHVTETQMIFMSVDEAKETVINLLCSYKEKLAVKSQNILTHIRSMFSTQYTRDVNKIRDEWYINSSTAVVMHLSEDMCYINFDVHNTDERLITTKQNIYLPLYRVTPETVVHTIMPTLQTLSTI